MFRLNPVQKELPGDELIATVLASHAAHVPTHQAIIDANQRVTLGGVNPTVTIRLNH